MPIIDDGSQHVPRHDIEQEQHDGDGNLNKEPEQEKSDHQGEDDSQYPCATFAVGRAKIDIPPTPAPTGSACLRAGLAPLEGRKPVAWFTHLMVIGHALTAIH